MTPAQSDLIAYRNTIFDETFTFAIDGNPVDITGNTFRMQVRSYAGAPGSPLVDLATVSSGTVQGIFILNQVGGMFAVRISQATLAAMPQVVPAPMPSAFSYDIVIFDSGNNALGPVMQGNFTLYEGVTV